LPRTQPFESLRAGDELPVVERTIDAQQLIRFAGAANDYSRPHWDHAYMVEQGFPGVIVHGWLTVSVMFQAVTAWIPLETADFRRFQVRYLQPNLPGRAFYRGRVTGKSVQDASRLLELEVWAETAAGVRLAVSHVTLSFANDS